MTPDESHAGLPDRTEGEASRSSDMQPDPLLTGDTDAPASVDGDQPTIGDQGPVATLGHPEGPARAASRRWLVSVAAVASLLTAVLGVDGLALFVTLLIGAVVPAAALAPAADSAPDRSAGHSRLSTASLVPAGFLLLAFASIVLGLAATALGVSAISSRSGALATWLVVVGVFWAIGAVRGGRVRPLAGDGAAVLAFGAFMALGAAFALTRSVGAVAALVSWTTDFNRHLVFMKEAVLVGGLEYQSQHYPRGMHTLVGLVFSASGGSGYRDAWLGMESVTWMMLGLILMTLATAAARLTRMLCSGRVWPSALSAFVVFIVFLQSMWISAFLEAGFLTSIFAGVVLGATLVAALDRSGRWFGTAWSVAWLLVAIALLWHSWPLFAPVFGILVCAAFVAAVGRARRGDQEQVGVQWWVVAALALIAAAASLPAALAIYRVRAAGGLLAENLAQSGPSGLSPPGVLWLFAGVLAAVGLVACWRRGWTPFVLMVVWIGVTGAILVAGVAVTGEGTGGGMNYYALKTMWSLLILIVPVAVATGCWAVFGVSRVVATQPQGWRRLAALAVTALVAVVLVAGVAGFMVGSGSSRVQSMLSLKVAPVQFAVGGLLDTLDASKYRGKNAIAWGMLPIGNAESLAQMPYKYGLSDLLSREATAWIGAAPLLAADPLLPALFDRDPEAACEFLRRNPDALRLTGPNPKAGAEWLVQGGCPEEVVRPDLWQEVAVDGWQEPSDGAGYPYPTFQEYQRYRKQRSG